MNDIFVLLLTFLVDIFLFFVPNLFKKVASFMSREDTVFNKVTDEILKAIFDFSKNIAISVSVIFIVPALIEYYGFQLSSWTVFVMAEVGGVMLFLAVLSFLVRIYVIFNFKKLNNWCVRTFLFIFFVVIIYPLIFPLDIKMQKALSTPSGCLNINTVVYCPVH